MKIITAMAVLCPLFFQNAASKNNAFKNLKMMKQTRPVLDLQQKANESHTNKQDLKPIKLKGNSQQLSQGGKVAISRHIISGVQALRGQFPWQAAIDVDYESFCGGSLITMNHVLTAAHCADESLTFSIMLGAQNTNVFEAGRTTLVTRRKIIHPQWNTDTLRNDISILFLPRKIVANNYIKTIRLPSKTQATTTFFGETLTISGWGKTKEGAKGVSSTMYHVQLGVVPTSECLQIYGSTNVFQSNVCARGTGIKATCEGDSGGPLVFKEKDGGWTQVGIVSYGAAAGCDQGYPDVFTRVSSYLTWISEKTGAVIRH